MPKPTKPAEDAKDETTSPALLPFNGFVNGQDVTVMAKDQEEARHLLEKLREAAAPSA